MGVESYASQRKPAEDSEWVERCVLKARRAGSPGSRQLLAAHEINTNGWLGSGWEATSPRSGFRQKPRGAG